MQNEPHTRDLYEISRGMPPGQLARNWLWEMAAFVKSVDSNHMVSYVPQAACSGYWHSVNLFAEFASCSTSIT
jgi:hypothetical protein